jgi:hypothetical protein
MKHLVISMKIYVRGRMKVGKGVKQPRFRVVAVTGESKEGHLKIEASHFRKTELEEIAKDVGAEVVFLEPMEEEEHGKMKEE